MSHTNVWEVKRRNYCDCLQPTDYLWSTMRLIRWIQFAGFDLLSFTDIEHIYGFFRQPGDSKEATACLWCCSEKKVRCGRHSPVWLLQQPCQLGEGLGQQSCTYWECYGMFKVSTDLLHHMNHIPAVAWTKEKQNINVLCEMCHYGLLRTQWFSF